MHSNTPVLMEFYIDRIPSERHVLVVKYSVALEWIKRGAFIKVTPIDPILRVPAGAIAISKVWQ